MANFNWPVSLSQSAPIQFVKDGNPTTVTENTATPANSTPLPVKILDQNGALQFAKDYGPSAAAVRTASQIGNATGAADFGAGNVSAQTVRTALAANQLSTLATAANQESEITQITAVNTALGTTNASLASIDGKLPTLGQKAMAGSVPVTIASDQSAIPVTTPTSMISAGNSSTTVLAAAGVFTGTAENALPWTIVTVNVFASHASGTLGLSLQQSMNGTNWDILDTYTIPATTGQTFCVGLSAQFFRVVYTNGATLQTSFRLQTIFHAMNQKASNHSLAGAITDQNDAELMISQMRAMNGTNTVSLTAAATGQLNTNTSLINGVAPTMGAGAATTGTQRVIMASDSPAAPVPAAVTVKNAAITVGTTAVRLTTDAVAPSATRRTLQFMVDPNATANFYYGAATVTSSGATRGVIAFPGQTLKFDNDSNDYYIVADAAAQTCFIVEAE